MALYAPTHHRNNNDASGAPKRVAAVAPFLVLSYVLVVLRHCVRNSACVEEIDKFPSEPSSALSLLHYPCKALTEYTRLYLIISGQQ